MCVHSACVNGGIANNGLVHGWPKLPVKICKSVGPWPQSIDDVCVIVFSIQDLHSHLAQ